MPTDTHTEAPWQLVRSSKRRPQDTTQASHDTMDYDDRLLTMRLALRAASPNSRQKIAEDYAALLAEDPLLLPPHGGKMPRQDHASISPPLSRTTRAKIRKFRILCLFWRVYLISEVN
jgi:hypothetical protein